MGLNVLDYQSHLPTLLAILPVVTEDLYISLVLAVRVFIAIGSSALLQFVNQWINFTDSRTNAFRYGRHNKNPALTRIELTISALVGLRGYHYTTRAMRADMNIPRTEDINLPSPPPKCQSITYGLASLQETEDLVADVLGVEVFRQTIAGNALVGSYAVITNQGGMVHPRTSIEDIEELSSLLQVRGPHWSLQHNFIPLCPEVSHHNFLICGVKNVAGPTRCKTQKRGSLSAKSLRPFTVDVITSSG